MRRAGRAVDGIEVVIAIGCIQGSTNFGEVSDVEAEPGSANDSSRPGGCVNRFQIPKRL
jgi:hypothetical protein